MNLKISLKYGLKLWYSLRLILAVCISHIVAVVCPETTITGTEGLLPGTFGDEVVVQCLADQLTDYRASSYFAQCQKNGNWGTLLSCSRKYL